MRLIDADVAEKIIREYADEVGCNRGEYELANGILKAVCKLEDVPTVEAVPVVHGEWIHVPSSDMATGKAYECSNCKKMRYGSFMPPFCQMCGADMRTSAE